MKKLILLSLILNLSIACNTQKSTFELSWKQFEFKESGMKFKVPCEPMKNFKSFQDTPRPIHNYNYDCELKGMKFLVSSKNYMEDFNEKSFENAFQATEDNLKTLFGEIEKIDVKKNFQTNGFDSRYYEVKLKSGGIVKQLFVVSEDRFYDVLFGITPENVKKLTESKVDFEEKSKKFFDSFQVIE